MNTVEIFDKLVESASKYVLSKIQGYEATQVFCVALEEAIALSHTYDGLPGKMNLFLLEAARKHVLNLSWSRRQFYAHYAKAAFELVADVYMSTQKRFVTGGQGEGWLFDRSAGSLLTSDKS